MDILVKIVNAGTTSMQGLDIVIENYAGELRHGKTWVQKMANDYGYIEGMTGADGDEMDIFVGPNKDAGSLYVVEQINEKGEFDEHKVMAGFSNIGEAKDAYHANYPKGWNGLKNISEVKNDEFWGWYEGLAGYQNVIVTKEAKDTRSKLVSDYEGYAGRPDFSTKGENRMRTLNAKEEIRDKRKMYGVTVTKVTIGNKIDHYEVEGKIYKTQEELWKFLETKGAPKENAMEDTYHVGTHNRERFTEKGKNTYGSKIDNSICECPVCFGGKRLGLFACKNCKGEGTVKV